MHKKANNRRDLSPLRQGDAVYTDPVGRGEPMATQTGLEPVRTYDEVKRIAAQAAQERNMRQNVRAQIAEDMAKLEERNYELEVQGRILAAESQRIDDARRERGLASQMQNMSVQENNPITISVLGGNMVLQEEHDAMVNFTTLATGANQDWMSSNLTGRFYNADSENVKDPQEGYEAAGWTFEKSSP